MLPRGSFDRSATAVELITGNRAHTDSEAQRKPM